jgi:hypothetical protein
MSKALTPERVTEALALGPGEGRCRVTALAALAAIVRVRELPWRGPREARPDDVNMALAWEAGYLASFRAMHAAIDGEVS